jgi:hypothetical protein
MEAYGTGSNFVLVIFPVSKYSCALDFVTIDAENNKVRESSFGSTVMIYGKEGTSYKKTDFLPDTTLQEFVN